MRGEALARVSGNGDATVGQMLLVQQVLQLPPADATGGENRKSVAAQALHHTRHVDTTPTGVHQGGAAAQLVRGLHSRPCWTPRGATCCASWGPTAWACWRRTAA
jgi:hypothetical protein